MFDPTTRWISGSSDLTSSFPLRLDVQRSCLIFVLEGAPDLVIGEAAILQETRLARPFCEIFRLFDSVFLLPHAPYFLYPLVAGHIQPFGNQFTVHALFLEFLFDPQRPETTCAAHPHQHLRKTFVRDQAFAQQFADFPTRDRFGTALLDKFGGQLCGAVFAPRQPIERRFPRPGRIERGDWPLCDQAPASCDNASSSSAASTPVGRAIACWRTRDSMSAAIFGLSRRNIRALSFPWPMRSLL